MVAGDRVRPLVGITKLGDSWKCTSECLEFDDFSHGGPDLRKIFIGSMFLNDPLPHLCGDGFMYGESEPHVRYYVYTWDILLVPHVLIFCELDILSSPSDSPLLLFVL